MISNILVETTIPDLESIKGDLRLLWGYKKKLGKTALDNQ